jgi:sec-independent protein translocase protein TatA
MAWRPGLPELLIVLFLVLLLFGPGRISKMAGELGKGIRSFREGISPDEENREEKNAETKADDTK